ncbi:MAG: hypothetical protein PVH24_06205 [Candidatus Zixiibacteriota bacterium]|jgi:hypothetical protein
MDFIFAKSGSILGLLGSLGLVMASYAAKKYVIPFLSVGQRQKYAEYLAAIADDVTDELRAKYPDKEWLAHLDEAVDRLIEICGVSREIARRVVMASVARK